MPSLPEVRRTVDSDRDPIVAMWSSAFANDPVIRWFLPDEESYQLKARALFGFIFDVRHLGGEVWVRAHLAAAAWTPPGGLRPTVPTVAELWAAMADQLEPDEVERIDEYDGWLRPLLPDPDSWYLGLLGTAPGHQSCGHGTAVARPVLERAAGDGLRQILETCVPANRELYKAWGFEVSGQFMLPGGPTVWVMVR